MSTKRFIAKHGLDNNNQTITNVSDPINVSDVAIKRTTDNLSNTVNLAYDSANSGISIAQAAYDAANNVAPQIAPAHQKANAAYSAANNAWAGANASYTYASSTANNAYNTANNAWAGANNAFNRANTAYSQANNSYIYASSTANNAYNTANNAWAGANNAFNRANTAYSQANNSYIYASSTANNAYNTANNAWAGANASYTYASSTANNAYNTANSAWATANSKLSSSGGIISGNLAVTGNVQIDGTLSVSGNAFSIQANNLSITDNMIYLNKGANTANPDIGFAAGYNDGSYHHTGFFRDATDGIWKLFDNYEPEIEASVYIDTTNSTFRIANFQANVIYGNTFVSTMPTGISPLSVVSTTLVSNLNVDYLDGNHGEYYSGLSNTASDRANSVYSWVSSTANNAYNTANNAWAGANNSYIYASSTANNAYITANNAWSAANNAWAGANNAFNRANTAYSQANNSYIYASSTANNAYNTANNAWAGANASYTYASSTANNAYITANNAWSAANTANTYRANASNLTTGTISSSILGNSTLYVGTTAITLNRGSASLSLTGVNIDGNAGTVTNGVYTSRTISTTSPLSGGGNLSENLTLSLASGYGDTQNPYASKTANYFLAAPNGTAGVPTFRAIVAADIPTLNQSTTGSAATLTTARTLTIGNTGKTFDGSTNVSWSLAEIGAYAATNPSGYTTNTGTVTSVGGTGTVSGLSLSGTVTTSGNLTLGGTLSASIDNISDEYRLFNNMGANHGTRASFDAQGAASTVNFGCNFVQGSTNGPGVNSAGQYYSLFLGLGNEYAYNTYGAQIAIPRNVTNPYIAIRYEEAGVFAAWQKISAGYADSTTPGNSFQMGSLGVGTAASGTAGEIRATNNITAYYSDKRLKNIFGEIPDALGKVERMSGIYYQNNEIAESFGYTNKDRQVGVIAQQVQAEVPEAVKLAPFDSAFTEEREEYSISGENYLTVQYEKLIPILIQAIKEQQNNINTLKQKIEDLEFKMVKNNFDL